MLRQILVLVVQVYLTADYCDPLVPGVFSFETDSFFVNSIEAKPAMPTLISPAVGGALPVRELLAPFTPRVIATARPRVRLDRYSARSHIAASPPSAQGSSEDH